MIGGQACRTTGETRKGTFHADVRGLREAPSEAPPSSRQSETATQPYEAYADTLAAPKSFSESQPQWCIDTGGLFLTMTTFELWEALERAEVLAWMRVWREGMRVLDAGGRDRRLRLGPRLGPRAPAGVAPGARAARRRPHRAALDAHRHPRAAGERDPSGEGCAARRRLDRPRVAVALAAVIWAILVRLATPPAAPVASTGASAPVEAVVVEPASGPADPPEPEATHHEERGQRRQPRGGRRAYGR